jgi:hypothetical protein
VSNRCGKHRLDMWRPKFELEQTVDIMKEVH